MTKISPISKAFTCLLFLLAAAKCYSQNVGISTTSTFTPDASAGLDISYSNKGLLVPRVALTATNAADPITSPAISLLVYNTATAGSSPNNVVPGYYYWNGVAWTALVTGSQTTNYAWVLTGNTGTSAGTNFIGTTDAVDFVFKTSNAERARFTSGGSLGIGSTSFSTSNVERLLVDAGATSFNVISGKGNLNNYLQLNIQNTNAGTSASSDVVATNDAGTEANGLNFIDMGVNSSANNTTGMLGGVNTAYMYSTGNDLSIGNATSGRNMFFFTGGTASANERMRIDGNGNIGIANTAPTQKLDIAGNLKFSGALMPNNDPGTTGYFLISNGSGNAPLWFNAAPFVSTVAWALNGNSGINPGTNFIGTTDATDFVIRTNNTERLRVTSAGNIGIGTTAPAQKLDVNGSINAASSLISQGSVFSDYAASNTGVLSPGLILGGPTSGEGISSKRTSGTNQYGIDFYTSSNLRMSVTQNGNVGIGTIAPATKLHVFGANPLTLSGVVTGSSTSADSLLTITNGLVRKLPISTFASTGSNWSITGNAGTSAGTNFIGTTDANDFVFKTSNAERARFTSGGSLGIGSTSFSTSNVERLLVDAGATSFNVISGKGNLNNYLQLNIQNTNAGTSASSDVVATADDGNESTYYVDMGINSSANTANFFGGIHDAYLYNTGGNGTGGNFYIGTSTSGKSLGFLTGGSTIGSGTSNNNERLHIDGTTGNIGIGTAVPTTDLTLFQSSGTNNARGFRITGNSISGTNSGTGFALTLGYNASGNKQLWLGDADNVGNSTGSFIRYVVNGTALPTLDGVAGDGSVRRYVALGVPGDANSGVIFGGDGSATNPGSFVWGNGNMAIGNAYRANAAPANGLLVQGNVGIGTTAPAQKLDVNGSINAATSLISQGSVFSDYAVSNTGVLSPGIILGGPGSGEGISSKRTSGTNQYGIDFYTSSNLRMSIINNGNVGIGTNVPGYKLTVAGIVAPSADNSYSLGAGTTNRWTALYATNGTIQTSDRRLKTNIKDLNYGLKEVLALHPVSYNWIENPTMEPKIGLIAQDVRKIVPEVVIGNEAKEKLGMNYAELIPVLINAIKEQQTALLNQQQEINELKRLVHKN